MSGSRKLGSFMAQWEFPAGLTVALASESQFVLAFAGLPHTHAAVSDPHHGLIDAEYRAFETQQHIGESKTD